MQRGRPLGALLGIALGVVIGIIGLTDPPPASACSCAGAMPMETYVTEPRTAVLVGVTGPLQARGVPVAVDHWFRGPGASPVIWLDEQSFGPNGAGCQGPTPPVGAHMILVLWMPEDGSDPGAGLCTPMLSLDTAEGKAMLADAVAVFGQVTSPAPSALPGPTTAPDDVVAAVRQFGSALAVVVAGLVVLLGVALVASRHGRSPEADA